MAKAKETPNAQPLPVLPHIHTIRKQKVVLDADIAALYEVPTFRLNEAVKRNAGKFPADFRFQLTREEVANLISQNAISSRGHGGLRTLPWAFTEHGCLMAATVLRSEQAVQMSLYLVRAFVQMREQIGANLGVLRRLAEIDKKLLEHDVVLREVVERPSRDLSVVRVSARRSRGTFRWGPRLEILSEYSFTRSAPKFSRDTSPLLRRSTERLRLSPLLNPRPRTPPQETQNQLPQRQTLKHPLSARLHSDF